MLSPEQIFCNDWFEWLNVNSRNDLKESAPKTASDYSTVLEHFQDIILNCDNFPEITTAAVAASGG